MQMDRHPRIGEAGKAREAGGRRSRRGRSKRGASRSKERGARQQGGAGESWGPLSRRQTPRTTFARPAALARLSGRTPECAHPSPSAKDRTASPRKSTVNYAQTTDPWTRRRARGCTSRSSISTSRGRGAGLARAREQEHIRCPKQLPARGSGEQAAPPNTLGLIFANGKSSPPPIRRRRQAFSPVAPSNHSRRKRSACRRPSL